jgi:hypothetical protein
MYYPTDGKPYLTWYRQLKEKTKLEKTYQEKAFSLYTSNLANAANVACRTDE